MPHEQMNAQQVSAYLHMDLREVIKLASRGQIPCRKVSGEFVFRKGQVDHWVEVQMHQLAPDRLAKIEKGVSAHHGFEHHGETGLLVGPMIPKGGAAVPLAARTREAAIRSLVELGDAAGVVYDRDELMNKVREREDLCSTALMPGVALPHPHNPMPYCIASSFVVVGLTPSGIPFGAEDGSLTRLFFLICCKDERTHLHVLARLARMLQSVSVAELLEASSPEQLIDMLTECEKSIFPETP